MPYLILGLLSSSSFPLASTALSHSARDMISGVAAAVRCSLVSPGRGQRLALIRIGRDHHEQVL